MNFDILQGFQWIGEHVWDALKQIGGAGIVVAISAFISQWISHKHEAKIAHKYDKQIEQFKADLDNVKYIQQHQFDNEYSIYQDLCADCYELLCAVYMLYPLGLDHLPQEEEEKGEVVNDRYKRANETYNSAITTLGKNAPFIDEGLFNKFEELIKMCRMQLNQYIYANPMKHETPSIRELLDEGFERTPQIDEKWKALITELRTYCKNMK